MKKFVQKIILLIIAATVSLTGAGVTIMNYCCTSCSGQTLFMTEQHICCSELEFAEVAGCCTVTHQHNECNGLSYADATHCTTSRLSVDIDASSFRPHISIPFVWIADSYHLIPSFILSDEDQNNDECTLFKSPPEIPPRDYLSLIRVLII